MEASEEDRNFGIPRVTGIAVDPVNRGNIWVGLEVDGVRYSRDGGDTWMSTDGNGTIRPPDEQNVVPDVHNVGVAGGSPENGNRRDQQRSLHQHRRWREMEQPGHQRTQIHHLKKKEDLVGACCKAGYDGSDQIEAITNEVQLLCRRDRCLSSMPKRTERPV